MAAEKDTPIDEFSGLPYAIAPLLNDEQTLTAMDDHHGWHPRSAPLFKTTAGLALRNSWIQRVDVRLHNQGSYAYHRRFYGPELPSDETDIYGRIVLACAGYVPAQVIDLYSNDEPVIRPASNLEMEYLLRPNSNDYFGYQNLRYGYDPIRSFMVEYALKQDLSHVNSSTIDEFLSTKDSSRKQKIGDFLIWSISDIATYEIRTKYQLLSRQNRLHPSMPKDPKLLVKWKLGSAQRVYREIIPRLESALADG